VAACSPVTITQMTAKSSQSFFQVT